MGSNINDDNDDHNVDELNLASIGYSLWGNTSKQKKIIIVLNTQQSS